jgi:hypothetical protein
MRLTYLPSVSLHRAANVLFVSHRLHPLDGGAIQCFGDGDVGHRSGCGTAMPVPMFTRTPNHIPRTNLCLGTTLALRPTHSRSDDERLTERMSMPMRPRSRLEVDDRKSAPRGFWWIEHSIQPYLTREPLGRPLHSRSSSVTKNLHLVVGYVFPGVAHRYSPKGEVEISLLVGHAMTQPEEALTQRFAGHQHRMTLPCGRRPGEIPHAEFT